ncbi:unnamed protein product [marine sediment metagenome]|uniref:Uncharacterized protein n=1 Tax=marine sediment metagenome TaxID=412755 RepID=X1AJG1_9ZZZZ
MKLAGVPVDTVHAYMGHQAYLAAAYDRQEHGDLSEIYKENMHVVTVGDVHLESAAVKDVYIAELEAKIVRLEKATLEKEPMDLEALKIFIDDRIKKSNQQ